MGSGDSTNIPGLPFKVLSIFSGVSTGNKDHGLKTGNVEVVWKPGNYHTCDKDIQTHVALTPSPQ